MSLDLNNTSVLAHLNTLQGVINRMAANSTNCKNWCVTLVAAIVVVVATQGRPEYVVLSGIPILLFWFLNSFYHSLERHFVNRYREFVGRLHTGAAEQSELFVISGPTGFWLKMELTVKASISFSIIPFYPLLLCLVCFAYCLLKEYPPIAA